MQENRKALRRRVLKAGSIAFDQGSVFSCVVRNMSDSGACLEFAVPLDIPERFTLLIASDHVKRGCRLKWRKQTRIGVEFS